MRARSYIAIHPRPAGMTEESYREALERVSVAARQVGVSPEEAFYTSEGGEIISYHRAATAEDVIEVHRMAGLPEPRVYEAQRIFTELLSEPHRSH